jgi:hypothetical protein
MCNLTHTYTVEVIGSPVRYAGTDEDEAVSALVSINYDEEGYVVAEHEDNGTAYCPAESGRIESEAIKAQDHMERQWAAAREAFHGEGPYALANQDW